MDRVRYVIFDSNEVCVLPVRPLARPFGAFKHNGPSVTFDDIKRGGRRCGRPVIALDANVLVRYLVDDHPQQAGAARKLTAGVVSESRGLVCREVSVEFARILDRAYGLSRNRIVIVFEERATTGGIHSEAADDTIWAADGYRRGGPDFAEQMIAAAAKRSSADIFYTLDRHDSQLRATYLLPTARR